jgi:RNA polymerase sigma-70 factor (ECF subfamily)
MSHDPKVIPIQRARVRGRGLCERSDDELMELAAGGVRDAFGELVGRYQERVRAFCRRWDPERGDDLAQEAFLQLWAARKRYQPRGQLPLYLFTIVRNRCRNARRGWFRRPPLEPLSPDVSALASSDQLDAVLERERALRVDRQVAQLPPKLREAVLLRFGEEMSYAEIASIVGAPEATVRSRVFNGLRRLQEELLT